jgi:PAS domain S-box-containing protein
VLRVLRIRWNLTRLTGVLLYLILLGMSSTYLSASVLDFSNCLLLAKGRSLQVSRIINTRSSDSQMLAGTFAPMLDPSFWMRHSYYSIALILFLLAEAALVIVLLLERKQRKRAQASIARRFALERVVSEVSTALSDCPADKVIGEIEKGLKMILAAETADRVCWYAIPRGGTIVERVCSALGPGIPPGPSYFETEDVPWVAASLSGRAPVVITRMEDIPPEANRDRKYLEGLSIKSVALVPTSSGTSATGLLILVHMARERELPGALVDRLGVLGNLFGNALSRKWAQEAKETSEELFRALFDQATLGIALEDLDGRILFANPALCAMLGHQEKEMQQMSCDQVADPEDSREDAACFEKLRTGLIDSYRIEKRYVRPNGEEMWGNLHVSALKEGQNGSTRVIAMVEDITERKAASEQLKKIQLDLQHLTARLIQAQEEERQRISRELHDDIGQRLSLLVIGLDRLNHDMPASAVAQQADLRQLQNQAEEVINDIHELSHDLHSTKLQHLGLKAALNELCRKISAQRSIGVDLQVSDVPPLGSDAQLCLYRVAQEALNNVLKHSGTARVTVSLKGQDGLARLQIKDTGVGFDPNMAASGLGLASMRERLRIVRGVLVVNSVHNHGTEIIAEVPLGETGDAVRAS